MLQFAKQDSSRDDRRHPLPQSKKIQEEEQVTEEMALNSLRRALDHFSSLQSSDGHWPGDFSGITIVGPTLVRHVILLCRSTCVCVCVFLQLTHRYSNAHIPTPSKTEHEPTDPTALHLSL